MVQFSFTLSEEYTDKLFDIKEALGEADLTGNEFAKKLLLRELQRLSVKYCN